MMHTINKIFAKKKKKKNREKMKENSVTHDKDGGDTIDIAAAVETAVLQLVLERICPLLL